MTNQQRAEHEYHKINWKALSIKDKIAYILAIILVSSGIIMAFLCFFLSGEYNVSDGVLFYCSESFVTGGGLLSVSLYVKNKMFEMNNYMRRRLDHHDNRMDDFNEEQNISYDEQ
ncbi:MAG: hypothetical protein VZR10_07130 [Methanobrevibacter sp.]|nr:hypothetical protein [Methanobrevibacter sp.]